MSKIKYKPKGTSRPSPMRTRQFFKLLLKNANRYCVKNNNDYKGRDKMVQETLAEFGLSGNWDNLNNALCFKCNNPKRLAKGKSFIRLGKAAKKRGTTINVYLIAFAAYCLKDLRTVEFDKKKESK